MAANYAIPAVNHAILDHQHIISQPIISNIHILKL